MSKPSEKAMHSYSEVTKRIGYLLDNRATPQEAEDFLRAFVKNQCDVTQEITQGVADKSKAAELEAQHRKTWALALIEANKHIGGLWTDLVDFGLVNTGASDYFIKWGERIRSLPCPPIEATKDK